MCVTKEVRDKFIFICVAERCVTDSCSCVTKRCVTDSYSCVTKRCVSDSYSYVWQKRFVTDLFTCVTKEVCDRFFYTCDHRIVWQNHIDIQKSDRELRVRFRFTCGTQEVRVTCILLVRQKMFVTDSFTCVTREIRNTCIYICDNRCSWQIHLQVWQKKVGGRFIFVCVTKDVRDRFIYMCDKRSSWQVQLHVWQNNFFWKKLRFETCVMSSLV